MSNSKKQFKHPTNNNLISRSDFMRYIGMGAAGMGLLQATGCSTKNQVRKEEVVQGFDELDNNPDNYKIWTPISDRKVKVGLVGYGISKFSAAFGFQDHPNVEIVAVSDLFPDRR